MTCSATSLNITPNPANRASTGTVRRCIVAAAVMTAVTAAALFGSPAVPAHATSDVATMCSFFSQTRNDWFSTTDHCERSTWAGGYTRDYNRDLQLWSPTIPQPANTYELFDWYNPATQDNLIMRGDVWPCLREGQTARSGFTCFRKEGYASRTPEYEYKFACMAPEGVSTSFSATANDFAFNESAVPPSGYSDQYFLGFAHHANGRDLANCNQIRHEQGI